ncbi:MAG: hypothetical protein WBA88_13875 [Pseudaminobacter sp.]
MRQAHSGQRDAEGGTEMTDLALILGGIALLAIVIYTAMRPL